MNENKKNNKLIANIIFFIIVIILLGIVVFNLNDINDIIKHAKNMKASFLVLAVLLVICHMFLTDLSLYVLQKNVDNSLSLFTSINIANTEYLFNAITPFASGGQPIQAYYLIKNGLSGKDSASILVANFIIYQFCLILFSTLGLIFYFSRIHETISSYAFIISIGFIINALILVGLILIASVNSFKRLLRWFFRLLGKIKFLNKSMTKLEEKTFSFVEDFQKGTKYLLKNKKTLFVIILLRLVDLVIFFGIPIFIFLALKVSVSPRDFMFITVMTAFASTFMIWIPTPGATGGVEWAFTILFSGVIASSSVVVTAMLFWRSITYILPLLLGFISYLLIRKRSEVQ